MRPKQIILSSLLSWTLAINLWSLVAVFKVLGSSQTLTSINWYASEEKEWPQILN